MKKRITLFISLFVTLFVANAQYQTVNYQYERNWFNENNPIPSETHWMLNGNITKSIELVELEIYKSTKVNETDPIYMNVWRKGLGAKKSHFFIPVNIKLVENRRYSYVIRYYSPLSKLEYKELKHTLDLTIENYLKTNISMEKSKVRMSKSPNEMYDDLNQIIHRGLKYYRLGNGLKFDSFSSIVLKKLEQVKSLKSKYSKYNILNKDKNYTKDDLKVLHFNKLMKELVSTCNTEANNYLKTNILKMIDRKEVLNYPTENKPNSIRLNIGYGGIHKSGGFKDMSYATAPYAGISLPLANSQMNDNILSRSSISFGVFLERYKFSGDAEKVSGSFIKLPAYIAYGIKPVSFMRINIGATTFEENSTKTFDFKNISVRPFIGIAFELDVTAKFVH